MNVRLRWMVRRAPIRPAKFGESPRDVLGWTVTPYLGRTPTGDLIAVGVTVPFVGRSEAIAHARRLMRIHYRGSSR